MAWSGESEIVNQFDKFIYSHQPANEPHGPMNQSYTGGQLAFFVASNHHNYVA